MQAESDLIHECINEILRTSPALKFVILMDKTGIIITSVSKMAFQNSQHDLNRISILSTGVYATADEQGQSTEFGELKITISEYNNGLIFITPIKNGIIVIGSEAFTSIGLIRAKIISIKGKIDTVLETYSCDVNEEEDQYLNEQLKGLFGSEDHLFG